MIDCYKFPFSFNISETRKHVLDLNADTWIPHYNKNDYEGDWSVIALRSGWGHESNIYSVPMPAQSFQDTPIMSQFPEVQKILAQLKCDKTTVRFMKLSTGADIKEHCDDNLDAETSGEARLHIPIQTHSGVAFYLNNQLVKMKEGECWYLNFNLPHSVKNPGPVDRIHLVIDCVVNNWLKQLLFHSA